MREEVKKANIGIAPIVVGGFFTLLASVGGAWITGSSAANSQIYETKLDISKDLAKVSERTAQLETITPVIRDDVAEIKEDLKDIKKALNIK